jgi:hypothetical protein
MSSALPLAIAVSHYLYNAITNHGVFCGFYGVPANSAQGISLSIEQYQTLLSVLPQVESALKAKSIDVPRPDYSSAPSKKSASNESADDDDDDDDEDERIDRSRKSSGSKLDSFKHKANHEATSDEDDD